VCSSDLEPIQAEVIRELLEGAGYRVFIAEDRESAMSLVDGQAIDLIIADHYLMGVTGVEVLADLRRIYPEIPAIMVSGAQEREVVIDAINRAAIRGFLAKPVDVDDLLQTVRGVLGSRPTRA
jgi:CheY-like chemotaxis protein